MMVVLYDVETHTVNYHLKKVFSDSELVEGLVIRKFRITASDGKSYDMRRAKPRKAASCRTGFLKVTLTGC